MTPYYEVRMGAVSIMGFQARAKATTPARREAGKRDPDRLVRVLEEHAATMPRSTLRYAVEKLEKDVRARLMRLKAG